MVLMNHMSAPEGFGPSPEMWEAYLPLVTKAVSFVTETHPNDYLEVLTKYYLT